ncbi:MAG: ABC transporter substrate-binding protein [Armatimonadetes bacterium]|nr:ABC transporter substrate-binding protein [Armatimonadota bacterium]MDW8122082.1 ABC transporter substrate-binding protein [Armatimonadota bacterium]
MKGTGLIAGLLLAVALTGAAQPKKPFRIAVVPMTNSHAFFLTIKAGAEAAGKKLGVQILWRGPNDETDVAGQISIVENFISQRVNAIVLAPCERKALVPVVKKAQSQKIPIIVVDSALEPDISDCFIATDNFQGGWLAGSVLAKLIGKKGKVGILQAIPGAASVIAREKGFRAVLEEKFPAVQIVSVLYGHSSVATAMQAMENMLTAHPDLAGAFAVNEITGVGAARVLRIRKNPSFKLVSFDASPTQVQALKDGIIQALIVQDPYQMGYRGVAVAVDILTGKKVPQKINTSVTVVTSENLRDPAVQKLLNLLGTPSG